MTEPLTTAGIIIVPRKQAECTYRDSKMVVVVDAGETLESAEDTKQLLLDNQENVTIYHQQLSGEQHHNGVLNVENKQLKEELEVYEQEKNMYKLEAESLKQKLDNMEKWVSKNDNVGITNQAWRDLLAILNPTDPALQAKLDAKKKLFE